MTTPWLRTLEEIEGSDLPLVGGKAFNLATLRRRGLPVPDGLVITTAFFEAQLRHHRFTPLWAGSPDVAVTEGALFWLADALKISPLADELAAALRARLAETFPDVELFAVRSSAIDEDTRDHAFSGIHLSELGVPRDMVSISLSRCWASALSKPALQYRREHSLPIQSIRLAVLVQPYIQSTAAGVAFTVNPLSGASDELLIEATFGAGNAVVSGQITPARYRLAKHPPDYPVLEWTAGSTRAASKDAGPLPETQLRALAEYLEQIEALMAAPQDVEWAVTTPQPGESESFLFLQTRSITALPGTITPIDVEWSRAQHREFLPELPSPLYASLMERIQDHALSSLVRLGFGLENTGPYLKVIYGRPYLNLTLARRLLVQCGLGPPAPLWAIGHGETQTDQKTTYVINWRQVWKSRKTVARLVLNSLRCGAWLSQFERFSGEARRSLAGTDWAKTSPLDLLNLFRLRTQLSSRMTVTDFVLSVATVTAITVIAWILKPITGNVEAFVRETTGAILETNNARQGHALLELARMARADEHIRRYLADPGDGFIQAGTPFLNAFEAFLARYGHHATFEADPGSPRHGEDLPSLLATIANMSEAEVLPGPEEPATRQNDVDHPSTGYEKLRSQTHLWASLHPERGLGRLLPWRRWLMRPLINRLHHVMHMRDRLRTLYGRAMTDCRVWDLILGEEWVRRGWLVEPEDYFWLTVEEIERALIGESEIGPTLPALVRARCETYETYAATEMPYTLRESDVGRLVPGHGLVETALSSVLSGLPVSPGQVQGRVSVLRRPEDSAHIQEGTILVTPSTDPAWFPIFPRARGLIVETGGLLSHGSIIAREFRLPAVANIAKATSRFRDGDLVLLDGSTGLVQILESAK